MSQLLAMSFDADASPSITLEAFQSPVPDRPNGWGFAWYPGDEHAAVVVKDPVPVGDTAMTGVLRDWDRFRGTLFVCHLRGAAKRVTQEDTHPFLRSYGGRDWVFAHNGDLDPARLTDLALGDNPVFEPVGRTDSERAFCWLMTQIRGHGSRRLSGVGWEELHRWLRQLNDLGTLNVLFSDGIDLVAYRDAGGFRSLHVRRSVPPHVETVHHNRAITLDLGGALDLNRSFLLVSTEPLGDGFRALEPGQMIVARRGQFTWDSAGTADNAVPRPPTVEMPDAQPKGGPDVQDVAQGGTQQVATVVARQEVSTPPRTGAGVPATTRLVRVTHETRYNYKESVEHSQHALRLRPTIDEYQRVQSHSMQILPTGLRRDYDDVFGNRVTHLVLDRPYEEFVIRAESVVELLTTASPHTATRRATLPLVWMPWQRQMMLPYLLPTELPETELQELSEFAMGFAERQDYDLTETLADINRTIHRDFEYVPGLTTVETTPFEVYVHRRGVCQDFANLFICLARLLGVPARYRVGYIYTGADYANQLQSEASHAWLEVYLPGVGWRGYDPTNGCLAGLDHVRVACGRNFRDATPTAGTIFKGGVGETLKVQVKVEPWDGQPAPALRPD